MSVPSDIPIPGGAWGCPLHPEVREHQPGNCPRCGTALVPVGTAPGPEGPPPGDA